MYIKQYHELWTAIIRTLGDTDSEPAGRKDLDINGEIETLRTIAAKLSN